MSLPNAHQVRDSLVRVCQKLVVFGGKVGGRENPPRIMTTWSPSPGGHLSTVSILATLKVVFFHFLFFCVPRLSKACNTPTPRLPASKPSHFCPPGKLITGLAVTSLQFSGLPSRVAVRAQERHVPLSIPFSIGQRHQVSIKPPRKPCNPCNSFARATEEFLFVSLAKILG